MIKKIKFLATGEPSLDVLFPKGHEIEIDSPHVLVVGSNGSGKTAFLRLFYTSLMNAQFYEMHGKMRLRQLLPLDSGEIKPGEASNYGISRDKARYFRFLPAETVRSLQVYQNIFPELGLSSDILSATRVSTENLEENLRKIPLTEEEFYRLVQKAAKKYLDNAVPDHSFDFSTKPTHGIRYNDEDRLKEVLQLELKEEFPTASDSVFKYVARGLTSSMNTLRYGDWVQDRIDESESRSGSDDHVREKSDRQHLWRVDEGKLIKYSDLLTLEERLQEFSASGDDRAVWTHVKPYSDSKVFGYAASPHINVRSGRLLDPQGVDIKGRAAVGVDFLTFGYSEAASSEPSSGNTVMQEFGRHLKAVEQFFSLGKLPTDLYLFDFGESEYGGNIAQRVRKALRFVPMQYRVDVGIDMPALETRVPENSSLAFLADEPTVYLDIENQKQLARELFGLPIRHPKAQLIVATNDTDLIRAAPEGTIYVVCQKGKPIASTREYIV